MSDTILRANSFDGSLRILVADTTNLVSKAHHIHDTFPVVTAALGRSLTAAAIMGALQKGENDTISIQFKGDGPMGSLCAVSDSLSRVKGYVQNPHVSLPLNDLHKLDVRHAVGEGTLYVMRDLGLKSPYIGQVPIVSGEIAEDITYYYANSEQTPSAVALGVLVDREGEVLHSGGFVLQLLPGAPIGTADLIEKNIASLPSFTTMMDHGISLEEILLKITSGFSMLIQNKTITPIYYCNCSRERVEKALISIGKKELELLLKEDGRAELTCPYCDQKYQFEKEDLEAIITSLEA